MIDFDEHQRMIQEVQRLQGDLWINLASQIHYNGAEVYWWFLIADRLKIRSIMDLFTRTFFNEINFHHDTQWNTAFIEKTPIEEIWWDAFEDDEIRSWPVKRDIADDPLRHQLRERDVFSS